MEVLLKELRISNESGSRILDTSDKIGPYFLLGLNRAALEKLYICFETDLLRGERVVKAPLVSRSVL